MGAFCAAVDAALSAGQPLTGRGPRFFFPVGRLRVGVTDRTIFGRATVYGVPVRKNGQLYQFARGSLTWPDPVRVLIQHDNSQIVGRAVELAESDEGLFATLRISRGPAGDRALALVMDGVYTGLSVGLADDAQYELRDDIYHSSGLLAEISLTPTPAYDDARIEGSRRPVA